MDGDRIEMEASVMSLALSSSRPVSLKMDFRPRWRLLSVRKIME